MFWKKKKELCNHTWYYLQSTLIFNKYYLDTDEGCYIFCPFCDNERRVYIEEWERIQKKQEIMKEINQTVND